MNKKWRNLQEGDLIKAKFGWNYGEVRVPEGDTLVVVKVLERDIKVSALRGRFFTSIKALTSSGEIKLMKVDEITVELLT